MRKLSLFLILIMLFAFTGCDNQQKDKTLTVAVSIAPQKTFVEKVCKDKVQIITTIPAGASAESYEMSPMEITDLGRSRIYFSIGVPAESQGILPHINKDTTLVRLEDAVEQQYAPVKIGENRDPHIWLSPKRVIVIVEEIKEQMSKLDPKNAEFYAKNAEDYIQQLTALDGEITNMFKDRMRKTFLISHPSYGYFAADYGLEMLTLEPNGKEATPKELSEITSKAKEIGIKVIFTQEETSKKQAKLIAKEIGAEVENLDPLSADYIENMRKTAAKIYKAVH